MTFKVFLSRLGHIKANTIDKDAHFYLSDLHILQRLSPSRVSHHSGLIRDTNSHFKPTHPQIEVSYILETGGGSTNVPLVLHTFNLFYHLESLYIMCTIEQLMYYRQKPPYMDPLELIQATFASPKKNVPLLHLLWHSIERHCAW